MAVSMWIFLMVINPTILLILYRKYCEEPIGKLELVNWNICRVLWILCSFECEKGFQFCSSWSHVTNDTRETVHDDWRLLRLLRIKSLVVVGVSNTVLSSSSENSVITYQAFTYAFVKIEMHLFTYKMSEPVILQGKMLKWNLKSHLMAWT